MEAWALGKDSEFLSAFIFEKLSAVALKSTIKDAARPSLERLTVDALIGVSVEISLPVCVGAVVPLPGRFLFMVKFERSMAGF